MKTLSALHMHYILATSHGHWWPGGEDRRVYEPDGSCPELIAILDKLEAACVAGDLPGAVALEAERIEDWCPESWLGITLRNSRALTHQTCTGRTKWDSRAGVVEICRPEGVALRWDLGAGKILICAEFFQRHVDALFQCLRALGIDPPMGLRGLAGDRHNEEGEEIPIPHLSFLPSVVGRVVRVEPIQVTPVAD
jgi:hypothetical protein